MITADAVEATEFPELAGQYSVYAVPKTVINGQSSIDGGLPEGLFVDSILRNLGIATEPENPGETPAS